MSRTLVLALLLATAGPLESQVVKVGDLNTRQIAALDRAAQTLGS